MGLELGRVTDLWVRFMYKRKTGRQRGQEAG